ncbi:MAG: hypothetical protein ACYCS8_04040 [Acidithiobacillus sp.]
MNKRLLPWIRKHLPKLAIAGSVVALAGCPAVSTMTTPQASLVACQKLLPVTNMMTAIKPRLTLAQQKQTGTALTLAVSYCNTPTPPANANAVVGSILGTLTTLATTIGAKP